MSVASRAQVIDELLERARDRLEQQQHLEAERVANEALHLARQQDDFGRMARILEPLLDARRRRIAQAIDSETVTILDEAPPEPLHIKAGCYLVQPPLVGADARRLRLEALDRDIAVVVLAREPFTRLKECPVVAIGGSATVRMKIDPPDDPQNPDVAWFVDAIDALGEWAIVSVDPEAAVEKRIDALLARLDAVPEHEELHLCLHEACLEAQEASSPDPEQA